MLAHDVYRLMTFYPKIFLACRKGHFTEKKSGVTLTARQISILDHLGSCSSITLTRLAVHLGVTPSTMSLAIDRLVMLGFVSRQKGKEDRRKTNLTLTPAGDAMRRSATLLDRNLVEELLSGMKEDVRAQALAGLEVLAEAVDWKRHLRSIERPWNRQY
jgi:MarR family transcriptional regulator, organic hydroperoxide resistance regulator